MDVKNCYVDADEMKDGVTEDCDHREEIVAAIRGEVALIAITDQGAMLVQCNGRKKGAALVQPTEEEDDSDGQRQEGSIGVTIEGGSSGQMQRAMLVWSRRRKMAATEG
ncbi:hypothetical protein B296_00058337 [Ensete ventricosum]|uniref:Uncharacterized protein n=1 Tax=Ensete ventricosum TaxID=4639 RepID=A0A426X9P6_ENSVE|nr:hypothetical protein B296_00058337 [Ensete ventricosum]